MERAEGPHAHGIKHLWYRLSKKVECRNFLMRNIVISGNVKGKKNEDSCFLSKNEKMMWITRSFIYFNRLRWSC